MLNIQDMTTLHFLLNERHTLFSLLPRHFETFSWMETRFRSGRNCSGFGRAAAGIESIVSVGELPVQHRLQKRCPAANRSQEQLTILKRRIRMTQLCCLYFPAREEAFPGT